MKRPLILRKKVLHIQTSDENVFLPVVWTHFFWHGHIADDFIVDDSGKPIKRKKYRDELSDS